MATITNSRPAPGVATAAAATPPAKPKLAEPDHVLCEEARARRAALAFHLRGGQRITGVVRNYGMFTLNVETPTGRVLLYKHTIDRVAIVSRSAPRPLRPGAPSPPASPGVLRPPAGGAK